MNDINPARLKAVLQAIDPYKMAPPSTELYVYGVPIVRKVLEADDQWRANHQVMLDSSTGITPSANPTSGGKVEQGQTDAASEEREPELPPKWRFGDYGHKKAYWYTPEGDDLTYTHADAHVEVNRCDAHELEAIARHMRYRQRLQDKRETYVSDAMVDAAFVVYGPGSAYRGKYDQQEDHRETMRKAIAAALEARKQ